VDAIGYIAAVAGGYLLGSIPFGFLVAKAKGIDIRSVGSGNIGATNVLRILGKPAGILVLVMDGLKGYAAAAWLVDLIISTTGIDHRQQEVLSVLGGISSILGHNYTCWLGFRGGKGIATSAGVLAALVPGALLIIAAVWLILTVLTGFVSIGSIAASFTLPFASWATRESLTMILVTGAMGTLAIYKHRTNIRRLLDGKESRLRLGRKGAIS
jgi:glycerol-3-phosphate acyltransferase PlsY